MKSELKEIAYKLNYDFEHYERCGLDWQEDLIFEDYEEYIGYEFSETEEFYHPNPVIFQGALDIVKYIDYPEPDNNWNVMSKRMYETLLSVGKFPHRIIPAAIVDAGIPRKAWYDTNGNLRKEIALWDFVAIQMTEHLDIFDYEKSKYRMREDKPDRFDDISEFVFKIPKNGLPPIFKIAAKNFYTFVSAEARQAMKDAKITGPRYISLKGYKGEEERDWTDTPIVLPDEVYQW